MTYVICYPKICSGVNQNTKLSSSVSILCPCVMCQDLKNGHRLTLKSPFTHHPPHPPWNFFCLKWKVWPKNTFLLRYYGTNFASIKRYDQFCLFNSPSTHSIHYFLLLFFLLSLPSLFSLSLLIPCSLSSFSLLSLSLSLLIPCSLSLCLFSKSTLFLSPFYTLYLLIFLWPELDLEECQILFKVFNDRYIVLETLALWWLIH